MNAFYDIGVVPQAIVPDANDQQISGSGVDMQGFDGSVMFIACAEGGEDLTFALAIEGDEDPTFATATPLIEDGLPVAQEFETTVNDDGHVCIEIIKPRDRYLRPILTVPVAVAPKAVSILATKLGPNHAPVGNDGGAYLSPERL